MELEEGEAKSTDKSNSSAEGESENAVKENEEGEDDEDDEKDESVVVDDCEFLTPINKNRKRKLIMPPSSDHGNVSLIIPGTPIVNNSSGVDAVPDWQKFSENICDHKPFEMGDGTPTGNFKRILDLTRGIQKASQEAKQ